jgi:hypothetical protein
MTDRVRPRDRTLSCRHIGGRLLLAALGVAIVGPCAAQSPVAGTIDASAWPGAFRKHRSGIEIVGRRDEIEIRKLPDVDAKFRLVGLSPGPQTKVAWEPIEDGMRNSPYVLWPYAHPTPQGSSYNGFRFRKIAEAVGDSTSRLRSLFAHYRIVEAGVEVRNMNLLIDSKRGVSGVDVDALRLAYDCEIVDAFVKSWDSDEGDKLTDEKAVQISREWMRSLLGRAGSGSISEGCYGVMAPKSERVRNRSQILSVLSLWSVYSRVMYSAEKRQWRNSTISELRDDEFRQAKYRTYLTEDLLLVRGLLSDIDDLRTLAEKHKESRKIQYFQREALKRFATEGELQLQNVDLLYLSNLISALLQLKFAD